MGSTLSTSIASVFPGFRVSEAQRLSHQSDAHGGEDAGNDKCETDAAYRHHRRDPGPVGVDVIFDHHPQAKPRVMTERDQEQHHGILPAL